MIYVFVTNDLTKAQPLIDTLAEPGDAACFVYDLEEVKELQELDEFKNQVMTVFIWQKRVDKRRKK